MPVEEEASLTNSPRWEGGGSVPLGVTLAGQLQGPEGGRRGVSFEDTAEYDFANNDRNLYGKINTPYVVLSAMLNTKPARTLFSIRMVPLPQTMMPGDLCPHLKLLGMCIKARVYTLL